MAKLVMLVHFEGFEGALEVLDHLKPGKTSKETKAGCRRLCSAANLTHRIMYFSNATSLIHLQSCKIK